MDYRNAMALFAAAALAAGCGGQQQPNQEFADATPDVSGQALEVSGDPSEGVAAIADPGDGYGTDESRLATGPEYLRNVREAIRELNEHVRKLLEPVAALIVETAKAGQDQAVYGPKDRGNATFLLTVKRLAPNKYGWKLEAKPLGGQDSQYVKVAAGRMVKGAAPHRGRGVLGLDLDAYASVDSSFKGQGRLMNAFAHQGEHKVLVYRLKGFTPDPAVHAPVDAAFAGHRLMPSRETRVRVASLTDLVPGPAGRELVLSRAHFIPGVGGRADIGVAGGDVAAGTYYFGRACWDRSELETFKILAQCEIGKLPSPSTCTVLKLVGDRSTCAEALGADADVGTDARDSTDLEPGAPTNTDEPPPEAIPSDF